MCELDADGTTLGVYKVDDTFEGSNLGVRPEPLYDGGEVSTRPCHWQYCVKYTEGQWTYGVLR